MNHPRKSKTVKLVFCVGQAYSLPVNRAYQPGVRWRGQCLQLDAGFQNRNGRLVSRLHRQAVSLPYDSRYALLQGQSSGRAQSRALTGFMIV